MRISVPLLGQAYRHRSLELSAQTLRNWLPEINRDSKNVLSLQPWPGLTLFSLGVGDIDAGTHLFKGEIYKITDDILQRIDASGDVFPVGAIGGSGRASIISNAHEMIIVRGEAAYSYDGEQLAVGTDADFEAPDSVAYLNNQAIYKGREGRFSVSNAGQLLEINGLNFATAESSGDDLISVYVHQETLLLVGSKTIEQWYNSGAGNPPFDRINGGIIQRGSLAKHSFASNQNYTYFLADDAAVYRLAGSQVEAVSTIPLSQQLSSYENKNNAIGHCFTWDAQQFYYLHIPGDATWCYSEDASAWFELTTSEFSYPYAATSYIEAYGKKLFAIGSAIYELNENAFTNGEDAIVRERTSTPVTAGILKPELEGIQLQWNKLELIIKTLAAPSGLGEKPRVMLQFSDDHGRSWSSERMLDAAPSGRYIWRLTTMQLGQAYERLYRVRISDPVHSSIIGCNADVDLCLA